MNGDAIWSKILTLKVYGSYEQQLGRKTSPALLTAHVLYFHFLCYPPPCSPRVPLQRCVSCSWDQQLPGGEGARGEWTDAN